VGKRGQKKTKRRGQRGGWVGSGGRGGMGRPSSQSLAFVLIILSGFHEREQSGVERKEQMEKNGDLIVAEKFGILDGWISDLLYEIHTSLKHSILLNH
jgi:hypothetical protein